MPSDFRQNGDNHEQLNIYYTSIIVKTGNKYNKFSKNPIKLPSISLPARIKKQYFFTKNLRFQKISLPLQSHFGKVHSKQAEIAQLVEHDLAKVGVASSSLVCRSRREAGPRSCFFTLNAAQVAELVDAYVSGAYVARRAGSSPVLGTRVVLSFVKTKRECAGGEIGIHATLRG